MIDVPNPSDWKELQNGVCRLFNDIGLTAETEKKLQTPRGEVEIDVFAVDENSVDRIRYLVECKNWAAPIPQSVVHGFTTVMHETGGNIGFLITKEGIQPGARSYLQNTNIVSLTYLELQQRYLEQWWKKYFVHRIKSAVETAEANTELFSRERVKNNLTLFLQTMQYFQFPHYSPQRIAGFKAKVEQKLGPEYSFSSEYLRGLVNEIAEKLQTTID